MNKNIPMDNTIHMKELYKSALASEHSCALVLINIKNFRYFNTKYGHQGGEEILHLVFNALNNVLEEGEGATHLYADNFALILRYKDMDSFMYERLTNIVDILYRIDDSRIHRNLFFSHGIYDIKSGNLHFDDALNAANLARKESDAIHQRNTSLEVYDTHFHQKYMEQVSLEIRTAEAFKNYEFIPFYQPKVNPYTNKVVGAEALLRWFDKDGNSIPLYTFLPILNKNSYIQLVDLDLFDITCKMLSECIQNNMPVVPISFNLSKAYFYDEDMIKDYIDTFEKYDIPKELVVIELMETITLNDTERMKKVNQEFTDYGFTCILDDFGNGYSSFNILLNADLAAVKMDRQFFMNNLNGDSKLIIKTVVNLIKSLHMDVIAEGVEEQEHVDFLKECGCDYIQGFYYYKPMPEQELLQLLASNK